MKRGIIILLSILLLSPFISADIIFNKQIGSVYNLGDSIHVPITIKTLKSVSGVLQMDLLCNTTPINFYKNGIKLSSGEEKSLDSTLVLTKSIIGNNKGMCKIKAFLGGDYALSNEFKISDSLNIESTLEKKEFDSGESISITGKVTKETGAESDGFIEAEILTKDIIQSGTITNNFFNITISLPENLEAGRYTLQIRASEKDSDGLTTNTGTENYDIYIKQVPTNLELVFENEEVNPGEPLRIKAILHDQTGEPINSTAFITIKNSADKIFEQREINTDEFFEYPIKSNEPPAEWKVFATSNKITAEKGFKINEKEEAQIEIINKTILITNTGNVFYNKTLLVKIGGVPLNIYVTLKVGESKRYVLNAPDGEYDVRVTDNNNEISELMSLTGKAIGIKEVSSGSSFWTVIWGGLILILIIAAFIIFNKIRKKPFFGRIFLSKNKGLKKTPIKENLITQRGNRAELSLSIKGEKQDASVICIKIRNLKEIKTKKGSASDIIKKITEIAEEKKAATYENQDYLFFIFAPVKTKTFKNEKSALEIAKTLQEVLKEHNRMFNQRLDFGISLNYGTIIAKSENNVLKFMSIGPLITGAKKLASLSKEEILLGRRINDSLRLQQVKTEKEIRDGTPVFIVRGIKRENEETKKFIQKFMERQKNN